jgi:luciferase family oxidoreductase group 1
MEAHKIAGAMRPIPLSVLDLAPIVEGGDAAEALRNTLDLARHAERWGYRRFWLAEHHNMPGIASSATSVVMAHVAGGTATIRVGAGGIMLPNHAPLVVAEQFGTLESLFPGRIDLGLGRAPGTDPAAARALRRSRSGGADTFPDDLAELLAYFRPPSPDQIVRAIPGAGLEVPVWILGSSLYGAEVAAAFGLPYAFASHFAPDHLMEASARYRERFQPSLRLARPHLMAGVTVVAADTETEARRLATSWKRAFINLRSGHPGRLPRPAADADAFERGLSPPERAVVDHVMTHAVVGSSDRVRQGLDAFVARTGADELIIASGIFDHVARLRSYEIVAAAAGG